MKKLIIIAVGLIIIALTIAAIVEYYPKKVQLHEQGVKYRLGTDPSEQLVEVNIEGKLSKSWKGERSFQGSIEIEGIQIPVVEEQRDIKIVFFDDGFGEIIYPVFHYDTNTGATIGSSGYYFGSIVINEDFSKIAILVNDQAEEGNDGGAGWSNKDGQMITVPASNRTEAISTSNEIMKEHLKGLFLQ